MKKSWDELTPSEYAEREAHHKRVDEKAPLTEHDLVEMQETHDDAISQHQHSHYGVPALIAEVRRLQALLPPTRADMDTWVAPDARKPR